MPCRGAPSADESQFTSGPPKPNAKLRIASAAAIDEPQFTSEGAKSNAKVRIAALASRQRGRVRYDQLRSIGVGHATISAWRRAGYIYLVLPRVYAVGHVGTSVEAELSAALLYAGPGAMLSHDTGVWWLGLLKYPSIEIHVSTPRRVRCRGNIVVHGERKLERVWHRGLPVTTPSRAILDYAATGPADLLRLVLANADYGDHLDTDELQRIMGRGIAGSAALRAALAIHLPELAHTRSWLERLLLTFCETQQVPIPRINIYIEGWLVDAVWPHQRVVVEVDGLQGHRTRAQLENDHRRDLELRQAGYIVLRYTERQLIETPEAVAADLLVHLAREL
jgi:very-short-patch-repair endonuclease